MDTYLEKELKNMERSIIDTYELAIVHGDESQKDRAIFLKQYEEIANIRCEATVYAKALEKASTATSVADVKKIYEENVKLNKKKDHKRTAHYKAFKKQLEHIAAANQEPSNRVECDEFVMESEVNIYDPMTKVRMKNPVRNQICGHHYEQETMLEAIQKNNRIRCPVAGCGNKQFVEKSQLVPDQRMKTYLENLAENDDDEDEEEDSD